MKNPTNYFFNYLAAALLVTTLSCSAGYNKYADKYFEEGLSFYENMEYEQAIESFNKTLELAPYGKENNIVYYNRGMAHLKNRQYEKAIYDFTRALEMTPASNKPVYYKIIVNRGEANHKNGDFDNALKDYTRAIELDPEPQKLKFDYNNRAWVYYAKGNYNAAIEDFSSAIEADSEFDPAYYGRATVWFKMKDYQRALRDAKEARKLNPAEKKYDDLLYEIKTAMQ